MAKVQSGYNTSNKHHHHLLRSLLMTACDLCDCLKEWDMAVSVSVSSEGMITLIIIIEFIYRN